MAHLQVQYEPAIRDFKTKLKQYTMQAQCGRPYVLVWQLTNWLKSKRPETETTQTGILLWAAYDRNQPKILFLPPETYQIQTEKNCCLIIFSILLQLDLGHLVDHFQRWGQFDVHLPVIYLDRILFGVDGWSRSALAVDLLTFLAAWSGFQGFGAPRAPVLYPI